MIVTPQGLNVFPEDVERALDRRARCEGRGVVGLSVNGEERIHAVLVLAPGADVDAIVRGANAQLEDHQRVWSTSVWPGASLPRTEGTQKLKRRDLQRWASGERADHGRTCQRRAPASPRSFSRFAPDREVGRDDDARGAWV